MKASKFIRFLRNGLFLVLLVVSLVLILSFAGYTQQEVKVIRYTSGNPSTDPAVGSDCQSSIAFVNIYDSLLFLNPGGGVKPWLAKSWTISEDGLTYTFELVPGVKFHNGDEVTADDVVFSLERLMTIGEGYGYLFTRIVEGAKALEKYKFQFTLKKPFGPFLEVIIRLYILNEKQIMANLRKEGLYGEFGDYGKEWLLTNDAGSGPYKVKEKKMEEYLLMEKFNDYWAGWENKDAPQYVKQYVMWETVAMRTLMSRGELEITDQWRSLEEFALFDQIPNVDLAPFYFEGLVLNMMLNNKKPPTDDIHFRKALAYLVDYQEVINKICLGSHRSGPVGPSTSGSHPNLNLYTLDIAKAEDELKQSSYYGKLDQYPFELCVNSDQPDLKKVALMVQANAAKLGIKVDVVTIPWNIMTSRFAAVESTPNGAIFFVYPDYNEAGGMLMGRYHSSSCGTISQGEWLQNPEIDAMIEEAIATIDQKERFQKYYTIQEKIVELCPSIWLADNAVTFAYRSDYVVAPVVEAAKQGKPSTPAIGYNNYYRDFKVTPEKAQPPYTPFKP